MMGNTMGKYGFGPTFFDDLKKKIVFLGISTSTIKSLNVLLCSPVLIPQITGGTGPPGLVTKN